MFDPNPEYATVLVVDNDPLVRLGTVVMLKELGYAPVAAYDAPNALSLLSGGVGADILVTDYSMPGMTGVGLAWSVAKDHPAMRILIMTGHDRLDEALGDGWSLLSKPFTSGELRNALDGLLAA